MKYKLVGLGIVFLLCWLGCSPPTCRSAEVWTDDFNDLTFVPEWTIVVNTRVHYGSFGWSGSVWSAANGYLQMLPSPDTQWGLIGLCSNAANGTWSFDIQFNLTQVDPGVFANVQFMSNNLFNLNHENELNTTLIQFLTSGPEPYNEIRLRLQKGINNVGYTIDENVTGVPAAGWHHIDVTRNTTGSYLVYLNGSLHLQGEDQDINTSEMFFLWFSTWQMIDNIVLPDVPVQCPGFDPFILILIVAGVTVAVIVIVIVVILLRRRRS
ncbi:MAG: hypothetical protein ACFE8O_02810 [Candidatus Hermodarchaeota archaeon]